MERGILDLFRRHRQAVANPLEDPAQRRLFAMMRVRQEEMTAAELLAGVLYTQENMLWEFYHDVSRHIWE